MDITVIIVIAFFICAIILQYNQAAIKGKYGEKRVSSILISLPDEYYLFNDIYIQVNGKSVQIDHVIVSPYGIFVIETKNYTGWIFGSDYSEFWTKNMYGNKYQFQNPLKQNYSHVKALESFFGIPDNKFIPIVVFLRGSTLKCNTKGIVIYSSQLIDTIYRYTTPVISTVDIQKFTEKLSRLNLVTKETKKEHKQNIRQIITNRNSMIYNGICPKCGNQLIERKGKYGTFTGCSNYPKCKFTK
jgi:predicted RNA-binding Zn-ribbon protein involved in translation (DUF1610 family)